LISLMMIMPIVLFCVATSPKFSGEYTTHIYVKQQVIVTYGHILNHNPFLVVRFPLSVIFKPAIMLNGLYHLFDLVLVTLWRWLNVDDT
jgi:hypothetical protein